jgi:hypothetical protein
MPNLDIRGAGSLESLLEIGATAQRVGGQLDQKVRIVGGPEVDDLAERGVDLRGKRRPRRFVIHSADIDACDLDVVRDGADPNRRNKEREHHDSEQTAGGDPAAALDHALMRTATLGAARSFSCRRRTTPLG